MSGSVHAACMYTSLRGTTVEEVGYIQRRTACTGRMFGYINVPVTAYCF